MSKETIALIGGGVFLLVFVVVLAVVLRPRATTVAAGPAGTNGWDALIGLGESAVDAYGYA